MAEAFPWVEHERPRFRDGDAIGHVNNAQICRGDRLVAGAKSVLVGYDYTSGTSVPLTENQKRRLAA